MELNQKKKVPKFFCEKCKYATERKSQYERHLLTAKHQKSYISYKSVTEKVPKSSKAFSCECGMSFNHRQNLYSHRKICKKIEINNDNNDTNNAAENTPIENEEKKEEMDFEGVSSDTIKEILKQTHEIVDLLVEERKRNNELTNQLIEVSKEAKTVNNNNTINNNVNNTFNLQVFLNEQCKDALNIQDFINSKCLILLFVS